MEQDKFLDTYYDHYKDTYILSSDKESLVAQNEILTKLLQEEREKHPVRDFIMDNSGD